MHSDIHSKRNLLLLFVFLLGLVPSCSTSPPPRGQDEALLLSIASHARMSGDSGLSEYSVVPVPAQKLSAVSFKIAPQTPTELDILVDLYSSYLNTMRSQGDLSDSNVDRLVDQLQGKIATLQKRSAQLKRRRSRRGGGLGRFFRRVGRGIGRFVRRLGRAIGRAAEYLIEDVAPEVIKEMVLTGQPLTAKVFWSGVRRLVRTRIKRAVGTNLARRGVPAVLLERAGLTPGDLRADDSSGDEESTDESADDTAEGSTEIGYGNHRVVINNPEENWGYFTWNAFWTNLPDNGIDDCQPTGSSTADIDAYIEDFDMWLDFELDSGQVEGALEPDEGEFKIAYEETEWVYAGTLEDGWVEPSVDATGWIFGGTVVFDIDIHNRWRCFHCVPVEGGCDIVVQWLEDEKSTIVRATMEGWTDQLVPGDEDEPSRLEPGGSYTMTVFYEGSDAEMQLDCIDCVLPADFPPPVYLDE
ncbi:MAG: hypothetical protein PVG04_06335 [Anaerolineales bacterium]|jgi:hypothetical protein